MGSTVAPRNCANIAASSARPISSASDAARGLGFPRSGKCYSEAGAAAASRQHGNIATVPLNDAPHEIEPETRAPSAGLQPMKWLEDAFSMLGRNTLPLVAHINGPATSHVDPDRSAPTPVLDGILHEVGYRPLQCPLISNHCKRLSLRVETQLVTRGNGKRRKVGCNVPGDVDKIDHRTRRSVLGIQSLQIQQLFGQ